MLQMPPDFPGQMIPIVGMLTGIVTTALLVFCVVKVAQSQIGQAISRRISGRSGAGDQELREEVMELRELVSHLEQRLTEGEERIDFTERLLARGKDEAQTHG
jgi:hypothetical protein